MLNSSIVSYRIDVVCYWQEYASITNNCHTGRCLRRCLSWNVLHWRTYCPLSTLISLLSSQTTIWGQSPSVVGPAWARERCRISPPRFLDEYCLRRLNQASFCFAMFCVVCFFGLSLVFVLSAFFNLSSVQYFPACTNVNAVKNLQLFSRKVFVLENPQRLVYKSLSSNVKPSEKNSRTAFVC